MGLFDFFNHEAEKTLAKTLAESLAKNLPPKMMEHRRQVLSANKISRLLEEAFETAKEHQAKHRMGFIKRAVLANSLKWELGEKGYPLDFINVATEGLIVELSRKGSTVKKIR